MNRGLWMFAAIAVFVVAVSLVYAAEPTAVSTQDGRMTGVTDSLGVTSYKGIAYAAAPVGNLRWRAPQPTAHWDGVRKADHFGNACVQLAGRSRPPWTEPFMEQGSIGEDCLYLNVWTAAKTASERRPVMVWFHGGGFTEGSASIAVYDGTHLAKLGVVLVGVNYRLGVLGFLTYPALSQESEHRVSGNYGLLDQIAALHWVQNNIAAFGGDPTRVTIFGQSAGAGAVYDLMQSRLARGLFVRAISESGPGLIGRALLGGTTTYAAREQLGVSWAESKGAHSLGDLRALSAGAFEVGGGPGSAPAPTSPVADGWVLPAAGAAPLADQVPLLLGMVADDIGIGGGFGPPQKPSIASYQDAAKKKYGSDADDFLKLYPVATDDQVPAMQKAAGRDQARVSIDLWSADQLKLSGKIYTYYFDRTLPWPEHPEFGAFHTSEVPYVFGTLDITGHPIEPVDHQVSDAVSSYWINFAASGNPNGQSLAKWPAYSPDAHATMELGAKMGPMPETGTPERLAFQIKYLEQPRQASGR
jgi:para-nitrobenzyl esterase